MNKKNSELKASLQRHFECKNLALKYINSFTPPCNGVELEFYYSAYFSQLRSILELMKEEFKKIFEEKIKKSLITLKYTDGNNNYRYLVELRNSNIHRGLMTTTSGHVINGKMRIIAPKTITNKREDETLTRFGFYLNEIIDLCEEKIGKVIYGLLESNNYFNSSISKEENKKLNEESLLFIKQNKDMPDWVKESFLKANYKFNFHEIYEVQNNNLKNILLNKK